MNYDNNIYYTGIDTFDRNSMVCCTKDSLTSKYIDPNEFPDIVVASKNDESWVSNNISADKVKFEDGTSVQDLYNLYKKVLDSARLPRLFCSWHIKRSDLLTLRVQN